MRHATPCLLTTSPLHLCPAALTWLRLKCFHAAHESFADDTDSISDAPPPPQPPPASHCTRRPYGVVFGFFCFFSCITCIAAAGGNSAALEPNHTKHSNMGFSSDISVPGRILMAVLSDQQLQKYSDLSQVWLLNELICVYNTTILSWSLLILSAKHWEDIF